MRAAGLFVLAALAAAAAGAPLAPPNASGVTMGHLHIKTPGVERQRAFWVDGLGAQPGKFGPHHLLKIPGAYVLIQQGEQGAGTDGSTVGHIGLKVRDLKATLERLKKAGFEVPEPGARQAMFDGPDGVRIELTGDPALSGPVALHHLHFYTPAPDETQAWYARIFGAVPGKRGQFDAADVPGANLTFSRSEVPPAPTRGRALDHIGFEVKNLEAFLQRLAAEGVKIDMPYRRLANFGIAIAFFTDPWGTYIELTEDLDKY